MEQPVPSGVEKSQNSADAGYADARPALPIRTLERRSQFLSANKGQRFPTPSVLLLVYPRNDGDETIGFGATVTKKIGNAVVRNRMKRRYRELARNLLPSLGIAGADHIFIGRHSAVERDFALMQADVASALKRARRPQREGQKRDWPKRSKKGEAS